MTSSDRRRSPRLRIACCVALETMGRRSECNQGLGTVHDVSEQGIGLETGQPPLNGQKVKLRIALDDEIREVTARTKRVEPTKKPSFYRVGLEWTDVDEEQREFLDRVFEAADTLRL